MQLFEALNLQREVDWETCRHPAIEKEFFYSSATGDLVCTTCGLGMPAERWESTTR